MKIFSFFSKKVWKFENKKILLRKIFFVIKKPFMYRLAITIIFCSILGTISAQDHATNIRTLVSDEQLIIFYDLSERADIEVHASLDGGETFRGPLLNVIGAVGKDVLPEREKVIVWNVISELGDVDFQDAVIKIVATVEPPAVAEPPPIVEQLPSMPDTQDMEDGHLYNPFRVDVCLGVSLPFGGLFLIEPKYAVVPNLSVGLKLEGALLLYDFLGSDKNEFELQGIMSALATADYHFSLPGNLRPFIGAGGGLCMISAARATNFGGTVMTSSNNFGAMGRAGIEIKRFRFAVVYNYAGNDGFDNSANYLGINIGAYIGGGRR